MQRLLKMFGVSMAAVGALAVIDGANAATGRANYDRVGRTATASQRMPSMPTLPMNGMGNLTPDLPNTGTGNIINGGGSISGGDDKPDNPDTPDPKPDTKCLDGGVENSDYTVERCMDDILACVNNGALPGGLNDMFNSDLRNSIINGMRLCSAQVDRCITDVRKDCDNVYNSQADVWIDFNARRVQPEYYNFVLRKTGLTPNQAENTCMLLDRNTYGSSFAAVSNNNVVTNEYNKQIGAYNSQDGDSLTKGAPMGVTVNDSGAVDAQRGHYARWDATTAECWVRVAAYNKDKQISNNWLFGAVGNDKPAEVWKVAGDTFTCNKDLFGFSLLNDTQTVAVVGVGGGTLLGVGIGAAAGHGKREFDCNNNTHLKKLTEELRDSRNVGIINEFMTAKLPSSGTITSGQCEEFVKLYDAYTQLDSAVRLCESANVTDAEEVIVEIPFKNEADLAKVAPADITTIEQYYAAYVQPCAGGKYSGFENGPEMCGGHLKSMCRGQSVDTCRETLETAGVDTNLITIETISNADCTFKPINRAKEAGDGIYCNASSGCIDYRKMRTELTRLSQGLSGVDIIDGEKSNMGAAIGIGAGAGAGAGGLATAITAFVERNNISCRVGDGLDSVGLNKSYSIGTLKDFYVKWNLRVPDTIAPTAQVTDCVSWRAACGQFNAAQCPSVEINYRPDDNGAGVLVKSACQTIGSVCVESETVAKSYGACK